MIVNKIPKEGQYLFYNYYGEITAYLITKIKKITHEDTVHILCDNISVVSGIRYNDDHLWVQEPSTDKVVSILCNTKEELEDLMMAYNI